MDSGNNIAETEAEVIQPNEVVATDLEATEAEPQAEATEETELYVDVESDRNELKSDEKYKPAFIREKNKRKKKQELIDRLQRELQETREQVSELSGAVSKFNIPPEPTLEGVGWDEAEYAKKVQERANVIAQSGANAKTPQASTVKKASQPTQSIAMSDEAEFHLYKHEQELMSKFKDYPEAKQTVKEMFDNVDGLTGELALSSMANVAEDADIDIAKVIFATSKIPSFVGELANTRTAIQMLKVMKKAEAAIKTRASKKIDSIPNPDIKSNGPVDNSSAAYEKARQEYVANSTIANFKKMQAAKPKSN